MADNHADVLNRLVSHFRPIFDNSPDGVYVWLDDAHKACNEQLATMFGYTVEEWNSAQPFLDTFVAPDDRSLYSWNYHNCVAMMAYPATFRFRAQRKDGTTFAAETDMIPIAYDGHVVAYHFVRLVGY